MHLRNYFQIEQKGSTLAREILGGLTTFAAMVYIVAVIPGMLHNGAGAPLIAAITATVLMTILTSVAMGLHTNMPFVLGPGLSSVAIISFTVVGSGVPLPVGAGIVFIEGVIFVAITFLGVRDFIVLIVPKSIKIAVAVGIGLFIALLGLREAGLIVAVPKKNVLNLGDITTVTAALALSGLALTMLFSARKMRSGLIVTIILITLAGIPLGVTKIPDAFFALPSGLGDLAFHIDILGALRVEYIPFVLALLIPDFFSTLGTALGVGSLAGWLNDKGDLPGIEKIFHVDSLAATFGSLFSIPVLTTYLESSAGVEAGARTGLAALVTSACFAVMLFLSPLAAVIPAAATAPVLIFIGLSMMKGMAGIDYSDFNEYMPAFACIALTIFTFNVGTGIAAALILRSILQIATGRWRDDHWASYVMSLVMVGYFYIIAAKL